MHRVWLNADDFGLTDGVSEGILRALRHGALTSTTAMVARADARRRLAAVPVWARGRVGLHLQLTEGEPLLDPAVVPSLVDARGRFGDARQQLGALDFAEVLQEWRAQLDAFRAVGFEPSHLDSHHDVHCQSFGIGPFAWLCRETGLVGRGGHRELADWFRAQGLITTAICETFGDRGPRTVAGLVEHLRALAAAQPEGAVIELACHPAAPDDALASLTAKPETRAHELEVLLDPSLRSALARHDLELLARPLPVCARPS